MLQPRTKEIEKVTATRYKSSIAVDSRDSDPGLESTSSSERDQEYEYPG